MILHLVRHPPPQIPAGTCYGRLDVGAHDVEIAAQRLRTLLPNGAPVFSSPLQRCRRLAECLHPQPVLEERLAEMHFGAWEGQPWDAIGAPALAAWAADVAGFAPPGGESGYAVQARAQAFLSELAVEEAVLVTHAGVMRALLAHWQRVPGERWLELQFDFATVTTVAVSADDVTLLRLNR